MRIKTKIVLAAAAVLSIGMAGKSATAMTVATPAAISVAATDAALVQKAAYCGHWHRGHHYGWYHHHG
jgi:anti-sigma-K factor RskA